MTGKYCQIQEVQKKGALQVWYHHPDCLKQTDIEELWNVPATCLQFQQKPFKTCITGLLYCITGLDLL